MCSIFSSLTIMGLAIVLFILVIILAVTGFVGYRWFQCVNQNGSASNVATYSFSFPSMTCSAKTCVTGYTMDSTGNCNPYIITNNSDISAPYSNLATYTGHPSDCWNFCTTKQPTFAYASVQPAGASTTCYCKDPISTAKTISTSNGGFVMTKGPPP